jgi:hypothetical protein
MITTIDSSCPLCSNYRLLSVMIFTYNKINIRLQADNSGNTYYYSDPNLLPFPCCLKACRLKCTHVSNILVVLDAIPHSACFKLRPLGISSTECSHDFTLVPRLNSGCLSVLPSTWHPLLSWCAIGIRFDFVASWCTGNKLYVFRTIHKRLVIPNYSGISRATTVYSRCCIILSFLWKTVRSRNHVLWNSFQPPIMNDACVSSTLDAGTDASLVSLMTAS